MKVEILLRALGSQKVMLTLLSELTNIVLCLKSAISVRSLVMLVAKSALTIPALHLSYLAYLVHTKIANGSKNPSRPGGDCIVAFLDFLA